MNILILGSGGREHALAWAVMQNPKCDKLIVAPGNGGIAQIADCANIDIDDGATVVTFVVENSIDFVIIGPEAPLANGVADRLRDAGILVFGPSKAAAKLEASKSFTKEICDAAHAPTAAYGHFNDPEAAKAYIRQQGAPIVVKADGLAAGKGVIVAMDEKPRSTPSTICLAGHLAARAQRLSLRNSWRAKRRPSLSFVMASRLCPLAPHKTTSGLAKAIPASTLADGCLFARARAFR